MTGTNFARLIAFLLPLALAGCIPSPTGGPRRASPTAAQPAPSSQMPQPVAQPGGVYGAPVATPPSTWATRPVTADAVTVSSSRYIVKPGDTLSRIANATGASAAAIARENNIAPPFVVKIGQRLNIPGGRYHLVRRGESGIAIARAYGVDWSEVATMNHLQEPFILRDGQRLLLPSASTAANMSPEQRAEAFRLDIDDIVTGGEPALAQNAAPVPPTATAAQPVPPTATVAPPPADFDGNFVWPVEGRIVRNFGNLGNGRRNDGINIAAAKGTPVLAAADGVIAYVGTDVAIYGGLILIKHGNSWLTAYGHCEQIAVTRGQAVRKGQLIGYVSEAGLASDDQLHFEIRKGRTPVDPKAHLPKR
ncbi:MAG: peptidoglycan DD-metalloendopeptidase family protein [Sphingomonadaceae bacterium]